MATLKSTHDEYFNNILHALQYYIRQYRMSTLMFSHIGLCSPLPIWEETSINEHTPSTDFPRRGQLTPEGGAIAI